MKRFAREYVEFVRQPDVARLLLVALLTRMPVGMIGFAIGRGPRLETARLHLRRPRLMDWRAWSSLRGASRDFLISRTTSS